MANFLAYTSPALGNLCRSARSWPSCTAAVITSRCGPASGVRIVERAGMSVPRWTLASNR